MAETFYVSASHPVAQFSFNRTKVIVRYDVGSNMFYASHLDLGCGKSRSDPEKAIRLLFSDHACVVTKIEREELQ